MTTNHKFDEFRKKTCLTDEDLYLYITGQEEPGKLHPIENHLEQCVSCRQDLAALLEILHSDTEQTESGFPEPSEAELDRTIKTIRNIAREEGTEKKLFSRRFQWPVAAAAAIGIIAFSIWSFKYLYETRKSENFFLQAKTELE